jgi:hypothetical protein
MRWRLERLSDRFVDKRDSSDVEIAPLREYEIDIANGLDGTDARGPSGHPRMAGRRLFR